MLTCAISSSASWAGGDAFHCACRCSHPGQINGSTKTSRPNSLPMSHYIDLGRRFFERTDYSEQERPYAEMTGRHLSIAEILANRFVVVVAAANYGKTTELSEAAAQLRSAGEAAIFTKLKNVRSAGEQRAAFDEENWKALERWRESGTGTKLTVILDSLDEANLGEPLDLLNGLRRLGEWIQWPSESVRWVISTRPAVLTLQNRQVIENFLQRKFLLVADPESAALGPDTAASAQTRESSTSDTVRIFGMLALSPPQALRYLKEATKLPRAQEVLQVARSHGLGGFLESPGGLDILAHVDLLQNPPTNLRDVFERVIEAVTRQRSSVAEIPGGADAIELHRITEALALACTMCQRANVLLPQDTLKDPTGALSARRAAAYISDQALRYLLGSQLFIDTGQEQVKIYPDQLLPYLAAKRLNSLIRTPEDAQRVVDAISWSAPTGEGGVARHLLSLAGWLATLNSLCRDALLERDPQAVAFFGDLRSPSFPVSAARTALTRSIERIAANTDRIGREFFTLTNENYWQAADPALESTLVELYRKYGRIFEVNRLLLHIAEHSRLGGIRAAVLEAHKNSYISLLANAYETTYLLGLGVEEDLNGLAAAFVAGHAPNESLAATLLGKLAWSHLGAQQIAAVVLARLSRGPQEYRLAHTLQSEVLECASVRQILDLSQVMFRHLLRACREEWKSKHVLVEPGEQIYEFLMAALVASVPCASGGEAAQLATLAGRVLRLGEITHQHDRDRDLQKALEARDDIRQALAREVVRREAGDPSKIQERLFYGPFVIPVNAADVLAIGIPDLTQAFEEQQRWTSSGAQTEKSRPKERAERLIEPIDEASRITLTEQIETIRNGTNGRALAFLATRLVNHSRNNRYGEVEPSWLAASAGEAIAAATLAGFREFWRGQNPMFEEDKPNTIYYHTVAGLQALHLEMGDGGAIPDGLTPDEVAHALAFGFFEINGFPAWFFPLVKKYPTESALVLAGTLNHAGDGEVSTQHADHLLSYFENLAQPVLADLEPAVWGFLLTKPKISSSAVAETLSVLRRSTRPIDNEQLRALVEYYFAQLTSPLENEGTGVAAPSGGVLYAWAAYWLSRDPSGFTRWIAEKERIQPESMLKFIYEFAVQLGDERRDKRASIVTIDVGVEALRALYFLVAKVVAHEKDAVRQEMVVYFSGGREYAERLRDQLLHLIGLIDSEAAYAALDGIHRKTKHAPTRTRIRWMQFDMQERRYGPAILSPSTFADFERNLSLPFTDDRGFAAAIHGDLLSVKYQVEYGEFSQRRFFSQISYESTARAKGRLALERDFQGLLGREMECASRGRYSVFSEPVLPEGTRRDLAVAQGDLRGSIELKMSMRWSIADYEEALEGQLVGKYMRSQNANTGFLVIVLQQLRTWRQHGKVVTFDQLITHLAGRASTIMQSRSGLYLRVIGISATEPGGVAGGRTKKRTKVRQGRRLLKKSPRR